MDQQTAQQFEQDLRKMGINPNSLKRSDAVLPPLPASDSETLRRNPYDGFYKYRAQEVWGDSEVTTHTVEDFQKCDHYLMKRNNEIQCTKCKAGWMVPASFQAIDGKLYEHDKLLEFAV